MRQIPLSKGYVAIVDDEDYEKFVFFAWHARVKSAGVYAVRTKRYGPRNKNKKSHIYLHREIIAAEVGQYVDHINGNTLDNRKANLRICTNQQNAFNHSGQPKQRKTTRFKGVKKNTGCETWTARITLNGKPIYLGSFPTDVAAAIAYNKAAKEYFGEFARLNEVKSV